MIGGMDASFLPSRRESLVQFSALSLWSAPRARFRARKALNLPSIFEAVG